MTKSVSLRIRREHFDKIVNGEKTVELRADSEHWRKRLLRDRPGVAVFVCGKDVHRRRITGITIEKPEEILGRPLSPQGREDIPTERCVAIWLGTPWTVRDSLGIREEWHTKNPCPSCGVPMADNSVGKEIHLHCENCGYTISGTRAEEIQA